MPTPIGLEQAWWCPSLDDAGNGTTTINDLTGNGFNGTLTGGPTWIADTSNQGIRAISFDGTDDWIDFGDVLDQGTNDFSLSFWFRSDTTLSTNARIIQKRGTGGFGTTAGWQIACRKADKKVEVHNTGWDDGSNAATVRDAAATTFPVFEYGDEEAWIHVVVVFDYTNELWKFYLNGLLALNGDVSSLSLGSVNNNRKLTLGASDDALTQFFAGRIDDVRILTGAVGTDVVNILSSRRAYQPSPDVFNSKVFHSRAISNAICT